MSLDIFMVGGEGGKIRASLRGGRRLQGFFFAFVGEGGGCEGRASAIGFVRRGEASFLYCVPAVNGTYLSLGTTLPAVKRYNICLYTTVWAVNVITVYCS